MFRILLVLFIVIPVIELWGLIAVGKVIGPWYTIALVLLTGFVGAWLAKQQGLQVMRMLQLQLSRGQMPGETLIDGALVLSGGIMLLMPGFFSDVVGIIFLIPYTRMIVRHLVKKWLWSLISSGRVHFFFRR
ncbi:membrane protein FxsA [Brevibacillus ruminantium]|uniref:Membrane protein FxsA n=1 Tax=Brevibacillus ruminantium TaxID=2950604 RepID=A0ABY4WN32_9BACL|nr:FxsA family protein [Brevibacillus ruminantium]USG68478.1 membrane protein FxsA [Brevibacillus ruminantium]